MRVTHFLAKSVSVRCDAPDESVGLTELDPPRTRDGVLSREIEPRWRESKGKRDVSGLWDRSGIHARFDHQVSATTINFLFLDLSLPKANKTVSYFVSFHRGAHEVRKFVFRFDRLRAIARRIYCCRPWLSDASPPEDAPYWCLCALGVGCALVLSDRSRSRRQGRCGPRIRSMKAQGRVVRKTGRAEPTLTVPVQG